MKLPTGFPAFRVATLALAVLANGCSNLHWASELVAAHDPDLVIVNANVLTMDDRFPSAQAFAVRGGRITAVGDSTSIRRHAGPKTKVIDAGGRTVLPGIAVEEKIKGSLEPGKVADFVLLSGDPTIPPDKRSEPIEVLLTATGGKLVYVKEGVRF